MKSSYLLSLTILLVGLMSCQKTERSASAETRILTPNERWAEAVNKHQWDNIYFEQAVKIGLDGTVINGAESIVAAAKKMNQEVEKIELITTLSTHRDSSYKYEIGKFTTSNQALYYHLLIWNLEGELPLRELEMIASGGTLDAGVLKEIDQRREEWIKLCNEHDAANLVEQLYSRDALYYNHKPMVRGHAAIAEDYSYMNRPEYNLLLKPIMVQPVNENWAFELGECSGSYGGKYMLVWQKDADGKWYVYMDSNL